MSRMCGPKLCVCPATSLTPALSQASTIASACFMSSAIGFSTTTCFPASAAMMVMGAWYMFGVEIQTQSTSGSATISSALAYTLASG